jgi:hypothetical protein
MKKYFSFVLIALFSFAAVSCNDRNEEVIVTDNDTYSIVYDINNETFVKKEGTYSLSFTFNKPIVNSDVILIFRRAGTVNGAPVWQSIPRSIFFDNGNRFDYDFDFTRNDFKIYADGNYDISTETLYLNNQSFRVVIVPAEFGGKNSNVDFSDYQSVIKHYKIDDSKVNKF